MSSEMTVTNSKKLTRSQKAKAKEIERQKVELELETVETPSNLAESEIEIKDLIQQAIQSDNQSLSDDAYRLIEEKQGLLAKFVEEAKTIQNVKRAQNDLQYAELVAIAQEYQSILNTSVQSWNTLQSDLKEKEQEMLKNARTDILNYFYTMDDSDPND